MSIDTGETVTETESTEAPAKRPRLTDLDRKNRKVARAEKTLTRSKEVGEKVIARAKRLAEAQAKAQAKADAVSAEIALAEAVVKHERTRPVRGEVVSADGAFDSEDEIVSDLSNEDSADDEDEDDLDIEDEDDEDDEDEDEGTKMSEDAIF
jgi:hypothetical protein